MAEKSRRSKDREIRLSEAQMIHPGMEDLPTPEAKRSSSSATSELAQEYDYVLADLRRIAVLALVMLVVLIALAFVLP